MIKSVIMLLWIAIFLGGCGKTKDGAGDGGEEPAKQHKATKSVDEAVDKVSAGMTLADVESLLGKGTPYAEVENAKEKCGFSPTPPEAGRNIYLWFRPKGRVYVAQFTDGKLTFSFTKFPPGE